MTKLQKQMFIIIGILFVIVFSMAASISIAKNVEPDKLIVQYKTLQDTKIPESMNDVSIVYFTDLQYGKFENKKRANKLFDKIEHLDPDIIIFGGDLFGWNFVQQLLKPSERTQKTADEAAEQHTEQNEKSCDIVGNAEFRGSHNCLK